MIDIGIDTSLRSTGIVILKNDSLWGSINVTHKIVKHRNGVNTGKFESKFIDKPEGIDLDFFPLRREYPLSPNGSIRQIQNYFDIVKQTLFHLSLILDETYFSMGIEIPMGNQRGAGAKAETMFASFYLALTSVMPADPSKGHWDTYEVHAGELKKFLTGKGNAKKELMLLWVYKKFGFETSINDLADAFAIAKLLVDRRIGDKNGRD